MASDSKQQLKRKTRIVAGTDLPGVPEGTGGKVGSTIGLTKLVRYRVTFDNGVERMSVAADDLVREDEWDDVQAQREEAAAKAAETKASEAAEDGGGSSGSDDAAEEKAEAPKDDRLAALLARSKAAKEKKLAEG